MSKSLIMVIVVCASLCFAGESMVLYEAGPYFPMAVGNYWIFQDSSVTGIDTSRTEIIGTTEIDGYPAYIVADGEDTVQVQSLSDGIYRHQIINLADMFPVNVRMRMLPNPFDISDEWIVFTIDTTIYSVIQITITMTGQAVGFENIVVPAGSFNNCLHTEYTGIYCYTSPMGSDSGELSPMNMWSAEEVGVVMSIDYPTDTVDTATSPTTHRLIQYELSSVEEQIKKIPEKLELSAFPNPFNSACKIQTLNPIGETAKIEVFDISGRCLESADNSAMTWQPTDNIGSGVYFIKASIGAKSVMNKVVYIR